jgi:hypothetical protein
MVRYTIQNLIKDKSDATEADLKKYIFEYANRVAAYLAYVFIESLRPRKNVKSDHVRYTLIKKFLDGALLSWTEFLLYFHADISIKTKGKRHYELDDSTWKKVSEAYKNLYPYWTELIEVSYQDYCNIIFSNKYGATEMNANCAHEWKKRHILKIGDRYQCLKCDRIVTSPEDIDATAST